MGLVLAFEQVEALGDRPVLRQVQSRQVDKWIFGSRDTGFYLRKFAWTPIVRHRMVAGTASPDDPGLSEYWAQRRRRNSPPVGATTLRLLRVQHGRCPLCQGLLLHADRQPQSPREWERCGSRLQQGDPQARGHRLGEARRTNALQPVSYTPTATAEQPAAALAQHHCTPASLQRLLEPVAWKAGTARF